MLKVVKSCLIKNVQRSWSKLNVSEIHVSLTFSVVVRIIAKPVSNLPVTPINKVDYVPRCCSITGNAGTLQPRQKCNINLNPAKVGMIVININDNFPILQWSLQWLTNYTLEKIVRIENKKWFFHLSSVEIMPTPHTVVMEVMEILCVIE